MAEHAKLSASGAHRWMNCPGSISLEAGLPDQSGPYAAQGTAAHDLAERCLVNETDAETYLGEEISDFLVDTEMAEAVQSYLDYVRDQPGRLLVEQRVDYSPWVPGGFGTADAIILHDGVMTVVDLKYGQGVKVHAEGNQQAMIYALGCLNEYEFVYDIEAFKLVIVQPRLDHVSEWKISAEYLREWAEEELKLAADLALSDSPPFHPSDTACRFCKAKATCRSLAGYNLETAVGGFDIPDGPEDLKRVDGLTNDEVAALLPRLKLLTTWAKALGVHATGELKAGRDIPGYKLVAGNTKSRWGDEEAAMKALSRKLTVAVAVRKKPITITEAKKLLGPDDRLIDRYTTKPAGKPTYAPISDKRPALEINPTADFEEIEEAA